jgi:hypothetical protein
LSFLHDRSHEKTLDLDQIADPDPGLQICGSGSEPLINFDFNPSKLYDSYLDLLHSLEHPRKLLGPKMPTSSGCRMCVEFGGRHTYSMLLLENCQANVG